eukprot:TRINITY_DN11822_c0_g1_i2.p1 TRINITY_DN11822_c0_g1~~TRINITY_DN11822_c0_g1_i2.p1  ORF type:complete len:129 (+),score=29.47 TRINITY_DN11822_c0_g1_i2:112-498(+)
MCIRDRYSRFNHALDINNQTYFNELQRSKNYINLLDMNSVFLAEVTDAFNAEIKNYGKDFADGEKKFEVAHLIIYVTLIVALTFVGLLIFLSFFKESMLRVKRLLGIIPTKYIAKDYKQIKDLIKGNS